VDFVSGLFLIAFVKYSTANILFSPKMTNVFKGFFKDFNENMDKLKIFEKKLRKYENSEGIYEDY